MKNYGPYLMFQVARFGALSVPQMQRLCESKCRRSSLYRAVSELAKGDYLYPLLNPASRTRAYYATKDGREYVFGDSSSSSTGVRTQDLDHTLQCAEALLNLCRYKNVTGIATPFEMSASDVRAFCHERTPDGVFRLTQGGRHYELALEVESSVRNMGRINDVLNRYWQTFKFGMPCTGLLIVAADPAIFGMYTKAIAGMPNEFQSRVRLVSDIGLEDLPLDAYGEKLPTRSPAWDCMRTMSMGDIEYSSIKTRIFLNHAANTAPIPTGADSNHQLEVKHE